MVDVVVDTLMDYVVLNAGLAYLEGPDGRYMEEAEWECLRAALEEMIDEHSIWLLENGVEVRERVASEMEFEET